MLAADKTGSHLVVEVLDSKSELDLRLVFNAALGDPKFVSVPSRRFFMASNC